MFTFQCSKLRVHPAPSVHSLAAGCVDFETCAPEATLNKLKIVSCPPSGCKNGHSVGRIFFFFFFLISFFYKLKCTGGKGKKKKKSSSRPFLGHSGGGQETTFWPDVCIPIPNFD